MADAAPAIPDAALEQDIAILGKKGRGKTYAAKGCVERLLALGRRVIVLDPLSTWWGLKAGPGAFPIPVLGGPHGDLPLADSDGTVLGQHLATSGTSAVLDLGAFRKAELVRFATPFLEELYTANRDPLWLVLEEADVFAPQQPMADNARLLGEVDRIARRGRQFGFRLISLTQRPAKLHKDVLTQLSTLVALGITSPQDREAVRAWVEGNADRDQAKAVVDSLASLPVGEGWVWAPDLALLERVRFPAIRTLDTSATPSAGEARPKAELRQDIELAALRAALDVVNHDPGPGERKAGLAPTVEPQALAAAERRGYEDGIRAAAAHLRPFKLEWTGRGTVGPTTFETADRHPVGDVFADAVLQLLGGAPDVVPDRPRRSTPAALPPAIADQARGSDVLPSEDALSPTARRIVEMLKAAHPVSMSFKAAALRAGASPRSSLFRTYRREVEGSAAVELVGDRVRARKGSPLRPGQTALQRWIEKLPASWDRMLNEIAMSTRALDRDAIADRAEVSRTSSGFSKGLRELVAMGLIAKERNGRYSLVDEMRGGGGSG